MGGHLTGPLQALAAAACLVLVAAQAPVAAQELRTVRVRFTVLDSGTPNDLFAVAFPDERTGFAAGVDGTLVATTDGGATWTPQQPPLNESTVVPPSGPLPGDAPRREHITGLSFVDAATGYLVTLDGSVLATTDGGATWTRRTLPPTTDFPGARRPDGAFPPSWQFNDVHFADRDHGWAVGPEAMILATTDAGATWTYQGKQDFGALSAVHFADRVHGHAVGHIGQRQGRPDFVAVATDDGGRTWAPQASPAFRRSLSSINFVDVWFADAQRGHVVGGQGRVAATRDGGRTWRLQRGGGAENLNGVTFADARRGLATGVVDFEGYQRSVVYATDDSGENWTSAVVEGRTHLWGGVAFADADTAYAVGCGSEQSPCQSGLIVRIDFPTPTAEDDAGAASRLPLYLGGAAAVLLAAVVLGRRRRRPRYR